MKRGIDESRIDVAQVDQIIKGVMYNTDILVHLQQREKREASYISSSTAKAEGRREALS